MSLGSTNITVSLVKNTLGDSAIDVGSLCLSPLVNRFSKYKPIDFNSFFPLSETDYANASYGFTLEQSVDAKNSDNKEWKWRAPISAYRLSDFASYYHDAPVPIKHIKGASFDVNRFSVGSHAIGFTIPEAPTGNEYYVLNVSNITPQNGTGVLLGNYYLGAAIYDNTNTLKGTYYSFEPIAYSNVNANGATVVLSLGATFNSNSQPIENYQVGTYTAYLFLSNYAKVAPVGGLRKYWPCWGEIGAPTPLNINVLALDSIMTVQIQGIRPYSSNQWANGSTEYKIGIISQAVRGSYYRFDVKTRINNISSETVYVDLSSIYLFHNKLSVYGGDITRASQVLGSGTQVINAGGYADIITSFITPLPATAPTTSDSLSLDAKIYLGNSESNEQFSASYNPTISLGYSN